jgi:hypothetical protein
MTPVFDDGTVGGFSFRAWGDLLAAVWNTAEGTTKYSYMSFYMSLTTDSLAPIIVGGLDRLEKAIASAPPYPVNEPEELGDGAKSQKT